MNTDLKKYLPHVFRNEHGKQAPSNQVEDGKVQNASLSDRSFERFIFDNKYALRLDEIA